MLTSSVAQLWMIVPFAFTAFTENVHMCGFNFKNFILYEFVRVVRVVKTRLTSEPVSVYSTLISHWSPICDVIMSFVQM